MPFHKAIMMIGSGANGKSTVLRLLKSFLGETDCSAVSLQDLCKNRFAAAQLYHKLANICADLPSDGIENSGKFKTLTGDDFVNAEFKFQKAFCFENYAKLAFSANQIPKTQDDTIAYFRRWIIAAFNQVFLGKNCDPTIIKKLTTEKELSGLLNLTLEGLNRILLNGGFQRQRNY